MIQNTTYTHPNKKHVEKEGEKRFCSKEKKKNRQLLYILLNFEQHGPGIQVRWIDTMLFRIFLIT